MSEDRKRKRQSNGDGTPRKKVASGEAEAGKIKVSVLQEDGLHPILVAAPGIRAPSVSFEPYAKALAAKDANRTPRPWTHDLILHSSKHPRIDYTAAQSGLDEHLSHYVAIFDPATHQLQVTPAHSLSLRGTPRKASSNDASPEKRQRATYAAQREQLGKEFGTKKAQKVIAGRTLNAITKAPDPKGKGKVTDEVQTAILDSMAESGSAATTREHASLDLLASKPIPKPNLSAETVEEVYPFSVLIPPHDARLLQVKDWQEKTRSNVAIDFSHRFPAYRVVKIGTTDDIEKLQALKYVALLLEFLDALSPAGRSGGRKVPKREILLKRLSSSWPDALVDSVRKRFTNENNELPKWHLDRLYTHICALCLLVDGWVCNTINLREDLKMENRELGQYFVELGARWGPLTEKERAEQGLPKAAASACRVARLKLPLEFPKLRTGRRR